MKVECNVYWHTAGNLPKPTIIKKYVEHPALQSSNPVKCYDVINELIDKTLLNREISLQDTQATLKEIKKNNPRLQDCVDFWVGKINDYKKMI